MGLLIHCRITNLGLGPIRQLTGRSGGVNSAVGP